MPPPKKLRQTRLANANSYVTVSATRGQSSTTQATAKQKSLAEYGFAPRPRASLPTKVEDIDRTLPPNKRRKLPSSFEVQETQSGKQEEPSQPLELLQLDRDTGEQGGDDQDEDGEHEEITDGPRPNEEFSPHFLASPVNDDDLIMIATLPPSTPRQQLPNEILSSQSPALKNKRGLGPVNIEGANVHKDKAVSFAHDQVEEPVQLSHIFDSQAHRLGQRKIPSSQEWENEDTQSKTLSTQASSQGGATAESTANQDETMPSGLDVTINRLADPSEGSAHKPIYLDIRNGRSKVRSTQFDEIPGTSQNGKPLGDNNSQPIELENVNTESVSSCRDDEELDSEEGDLDHNPDGFEFKPVRTQQLPSSMLVPQPSIATISPESLNSSATQTENTGSVPNPEEHNDTSNFSQLLPETLMETFPLPPPLSQLDSYGSGSDTE